MNFDELKERLASESKQTWERFQDSSIYNQMKDRYEDMSPLMQKLTVGGIVFVISAIVLSFPYGSYHASGENVADFEQKRSVIRELLKVSREASEIPNIASPPAMDVLKSMADTQIKNANLIPEQIKSIETGSGDSKLIPQNLSSGSLLVNLAKLNLRQVVDLGFQLQSLNPSVKMQDLTITANREDSRYFDVVYKLIALAVPSEFSGGADAGDMPPPPPPRAQPSKGKKGR